MIKGCASDRMYKYGDRYKFGRMWYYFALDEHEGEDV